MRCYDFVMAGGGLSGLTLAYFLTHSQLKSASIAIIDKQFTNRPFQSWTYWSDHPTPFDSIARKKWSALAAFSVGFDKKLPLSRYHLADITQDALFTFITHELTHHHVELIQGTIERIENQSTCARVITDTEKIQGKWVFDSTFSWEFLQKQELLNMHGLGWNLQTMTPVFDSDTLTFFDFRLSHLQPVFFFVMPFSQTTASIVCTFIDPQKRSTSSTIYNDLLQHYVEQILHIKLYTKKVDTINTIPMSSYTFPRRLGTRTMAIGIKGGRVKASSGYGYTRILDDGQRFTDTLVKTGQPFYHEPSSLFSRWLDKLTVRTINKNPRCIEQIFTQLFANNTGDDILGFLNESNTFKQNVEVMKKVDPKPFLLALLG